MAKCDEGYLCEVCGQPVERLDESALYLQFVIGWIDPETLHSCKECHLNCQPALAQFIDDDEFEAVTVEGELGRQQLDPNFAADRAALVTRGYRRLRELQSKRRGLTVTDYPLPEAKAKWQ